MENEDSDVKQTALDNKSAYAGNLSPDPEMDTDQLGKQAGVDVQSAKPLSVAENFIQRDQRRYELEVDSLLSDANSDDLTSDSSGFVGLQGETDELEIVQTETGQHEGIETQEILSAPSPDSSSEGSDNAGDAI
jgi:hypothetical protein